MLSFHFVPGSKMADATAIEWTDATWNPVTGCTKISAGCDHCYAERFSERFRGTGIFVLINDCGGTRRA